MNILVTGGSGFIGTQLVRQLLERGDCVTVLTRSPELAIRTLGDSVGLVTDLRDIDSDRVIDAVINLAGEPILDHRWTERQKSLIYGSRIDTTRAVTKLINRLQKKPRRLLSGSAIGYYGPRKDDLILDENGVVVPGFTHKLCHDWETETRDAEKHGVLVTLLRTGVVLGNGGALTRMLLPFKLGLGGPISDGKQWFSWIHITDMIRGILYLLDHPTLSGPFNLTAPEPVTNGELSLILGNTLNRPAILRTPGFVFRLMLGEGAELLIEGQRVMPSKLLSAGFEFKYSGLEMALQEIMG